MSIASEITRIQTNISNAYTQAQAKGATMPATQNSANLASTISTISTGAPGKYVPLTTSSGKLIYDPAATLLNLTGVTDIGNYILTEAYKGNTTISGALDLSNLTTVSGTLAMQDCFSGCTNLTSINLHNLTTISGNNAMSGCFDNCTGLTSVDLSNLTTVSNSGALNACFRNCTGLASIDLSGLINIPGGTTGAFSQCFARCTSLTTITIGSSVQAINFGTRVNQFGNMFSGCSQDITLNIATDQTTLSAFTGYPNFGCTGTLTINYLI